MAKTLIPSPKIDPRYACFDLKIRPSKIHRYGVYAQEAIPGNRKVIEYTGERIDEAEVQRREGDGFTYFFELDKEWTLDGAVGGSGAEIINHSCDPNLISRIMKGHILYMSLRPIQPGEELTIDYQFEPSDDKSQCSCGAKICRGTIEKIAEKLPEKPAVKTAKKVAKKTRK